MLSLLILNIFCFYNCIKNITIYFLYMFKTNYCSIYHNKLFIYYI